MPSLQIRPRSQISRAAISPSSAVWDISQTFPLKQLFVSNFNYVTKQQVDFLLSVTCQQFSSNGPGYP